MRSEEILVASVPSDHPFVQRSSPGRPRRGAPAGALVRLLPDPHPDDPARVADGRWWPPVVLRPGWAAAADFDLAHVHFGFDSSTPGELSAWCDTLRRRGRPLVLTVHDLRNPHHEDPTVLPAQLDVLLPAATRVLTLTPFAARRIAGVWGVEAVVVPHPHVVDLDVMAAVRARREQASSGPTAPTVGVAAKELRAGTDVARLLPALVRVTRRLGARLVVTVHREVVRRQDRRASDLGRALVVATRHPGVQVVVHDRWDDATLWHHVAGLDVAVLPYRWGTHSGWLEMCHDLGTSVVAPSFGGFADQGADALFAADELTLDEASLEAAVTSALGRRDQSLPGLDVDERARQARTVRRQVRRTYLEALHAASRQPGRAAG